MPQTAPTPIDALPPAPSTASPSTFATLADAFVAALANLRTQTNNAATNVYNNAVDCYNNAVAALASQVAAAASAVAAAASATTAVNAPGTNGTSTTSTAIGTGSKTLVTQTGKNFAAGMPVLISRTSDPVMSWMQGICTAYTSGSGSITVNVLNIGATTGTFTDWTLSLSAFPTQASATYLRKTANYTAANLDDIDADTSAGAFTITLPASPLNRHIVWVKDVAGTFATYNLTIGRNGEKIMGLAEDLVCRTKNAAFALEYDNSTNGWRVR